MLTLLLIPFRNGEAWAGYAIGLIGLLGSLSLGYIVYIVKTRTAGDPPFGFMVALNLILMGGLISFLIAS